MVFKKILMFPVKSASEGDEVPELTSGWVQGVRHRRSGRA